MDSINLKGVGSWIWHPAAIDARQEFVLFYGMFRLPEGTASVALYASADSRYVLHVDTGDGVRMLGRGPARSDPWHTSLDPYLFTDVGSRGIIRIWTQVRWGATPVENAYCEMHTASAGLLVIAIFQDAEGRVLGRAGSDSDWLACRSVGITALHGPEPLWSLSLSGTESHDSAGWPMDWLSSDGASQGRDWKNVICRNAPYFKGDAPWPTDAHYLIPREIKQPLEARGAFRVSLTVGDVEISDSSIFPLRVQPRGTCRILLDAAEAKNAYLTLGMEGGESRATLTYAEVLYNATGDKTFTLKPGVSLKGHSDRFFLRGSGGETKFSFETFNWRAFRFMQLDVEAGPHGTTIDLGFRQTSYFAENKLVLDGEGQHARFLKDIVDVSWRTLQCCSWETYMDCPYYEQLQYIGDTRIQVLCTYVLTGDTSLPVQALRAFDRSRVHEGITASRYPSSELQLIPTFSLVYILMVDDFRAFSGNREILAELQPGFAGILGWFERLVDSDTGLVGRVPYWLFVDWVPQWKNGVPPGQISSIINLHYLLALQAAVRVEECLGGSASEAYAARARVLGDRIREVFFDEDVELLSDQPRGETELTYSQHAQALAILGDVLTGDTARKALSISLAAHSDCEEQVGVPITRASIYFSFYIAEALAKLEMGQLFWPILNNHREALARGSTTWPESPEPARSECHAWGAWPAYFIARHILGVGGCDQLTGAARVTPLRCSPIDVVSGVVQTCNGPVAVEIDWSRNRIVVNGKLQGVEF